MAPQSDAIVMATIVAGAVAATVIDVRTRRVPNALTALLASLGVAFAASGISGVNLLVDAGHWMSSLTGSWEPGQMIANLLLGRG